MDSRQDGRDHRNDYISPGPSTGTVAHSSNAAQQHQYMQPNAQNSRDAQGDAAHVRPGRTLPLPGPSSPETWRALRGETKHETPRSLLPPQQYVNEASRDYKSADFKRHFVAMTGEFVGTTLFLLFAFAGTQIANTATSPNTSELSQLMYISASFGFSLLINVWVFYRISGGLFNPAVTFGMVISGQVPPLRGALLCPAQLLAGIVAAGITSAMFPGPMPVNTTLGSGASTAQGFFIEAFATSLLVITVLMLAAEKSKATFIAPIGIGIALLVAELATVSFTGGSLNPARSFGPAVVTREFPTYHWIYWIGPAFGAIMASGFYRFVKYFDYEEANPGQDASDDEEQA